MAPIWGCFGQNSKQYDGTPRDIFNSGLPWYLSFPSIYCLGHSLPCTLYLEEAGPVWSGVGVGGLVQILKV